MTWHWAMILNRYSKHQHSSIVLLRQRAGESLPGKRFSSVCVKRMHVPGRRFKSPRYAPETHTVSSQSKENENILLYCPYFQRQPYVLSQVTFLPRTSRLPSRRALSRSLRAGTRTGADRQQHASSREGRPGSSAGCPCRPCDLRPQRYRRPGLTGSERPGLTSQPLAPRQPPPASASAAAEPPRANDASLPALPWSGADGVSGPPAARPSLSERRRDRGAPGRRWPRALPPRGAAARDREPLPGFASSACSRRPALLTAGSGAWPSPASACSALPGSSGSAMLPARRARLRPLKFQTSPGANPPQRHRQRRPWLASGSRGRVRPQREREPLPASAASQRPFLPGRAGAIVGP